MTYKFYTKKLTAEGKNYYNKLKKLSEKGQNFVHHKTPKLSRNDIYNIENALKLEGYFGVAFDFGMTVIGYGFLEGGRTL